MPIMNPSAQRIIDIARSVTTETIPDGVVDRESPYVAEALGTALAERPSSHAVDTVVLWNDPYTTVLGHVLARELPADLIYANAEEGVLTLTAQPAQDSRVALLDYEWDAFPGLAPLLTMLRRSAPVIAIAGATPASAGAPSRSRRRRSARPRFHNLVRR
jgi:hypothetical protein